MPIGLVSDDAFLSELTNVSNRNKSVDEVRSEVVLRRDDDSLEDDSPVEVVSPVREVEVINQVHSEIISQVRAGRSQGDTNVPDSLRKLIADTHLMDGRDAALELASDFGISASSVSAYAKGATSTKSYNTPSAGIIQHINKTRERAVKRASKTLNAALGAITQEKLDYTDADKLSGIAKDMSVIIKNLEPREVASPQDTPNQPQFVIFAPQFRTENSFESITVNE